MAKNKNIQIFKFKLYKTSSSIRKLSKSLNKEINNLI